MRSECRKFGWRDPKNDERININDDLPDDAANGMSNN